MSIQFCNGGITRTLLEAKHCSVQSYIMCNSWRCFSLKVAHSESKNFHEILMQYNKVSCFLFSVFNWTLIKSEVKYTEGAKY
jgi:hypothetical protein